MKKGFTFLEMLVVLAIIAILMAVSTISYNKIISSGETAKCEELVKNTATALAVMFNETGFWPRILREDGGDVEGILDEVHAYPIAYRKYMSLSADSNAKKLSGFDRFGIVTPWAAAVIKRKGKNAKLSDRVPSGGTIQDHILRYAVDVDGDGVIPKARVGGQEIRVRATVIVWCCGKDGKIKAYAHGRKSDDVYSWGAGEIDEKN
jgi:prepilin-type N-terminal cleavage/methylation domain-containing protein